MQPSAKRCATNPSLMPTILLVHAFSFLLLHDIARNRRLSKAARKCLSNPLLFTPAHILRPVVPAFHAGSAQLRMQAAFVLQYLTRLNILLNERYHAACSIIETLLVAETDKDEVRSRAQSLARNSVIAIIDRFCTMEGKTAGTPNSTRAARISADAQALAHPLRQGCVHPLVGTVFERIRVLVGETRGEFPARSRKNHHCCGEFVPPGKVQTKAHQ